MNEHCDCVAGNGEPDAVNEARGIDTPIYSSEKTDTKILGFLCNWCAYAGADLAGVSRVQYPPDMRVIRVMCSGRVDPLLVFRAFRKGSDGVAILGCHPGDCHYQVGNFQAEKKVNMIRKVMEKIGIEQDRLLLDWVSAAEGIRFGEVVTGFINRIHDLGPIDRKGDFTDRLAIGEAVAEGDRIRWLVGKELELLEQGNVYDEKMDEKEFREILHMNIDQEFDKERIMATIEEAPLGVADISTKIDMPTSLVFRYLTSMENNGQVELTGFHENAPSYLKARPVGEEGGE
jgi:F420-non-reducing hydrogenase iron-sulfur subunit